MKATIFAAVFSLAATGAFAAPEPNRVVAARAAQSSEAAMKPCHVGYLAFWQDQCTNDCGGVAASCAQFKGELNPVLTPLGGPMTIRKYESQDRVTVTADTPMYVCTTCQGKHDGKKF